MNGNKIKYYQLSHEELFSTFQTSQEGLSESQSEERLKVYGENKLQAVNREPLAFKLFRQFKDLMVIIMLFAGILSVYLHEYRDAVIMFAIVFINASIGFVQEYKAEKTMNSLKLMVKSKAKVFRKGKVIEISGEELVPGDIVQLDEGDAVPADIRIFHENSFGTNDFALTGESNPTKKFTHAIRSDVNLAEQNNIAFMGTTVAVGNAIGVVVQTGMQTEIGRIANLSQNTSEGLSPLQKEMNHLAKKLAIIAVTIAGSLFIVGLLLNFNLREAFLFALGVASACVPQGLPAQVSVALSLASGRLAKKQVIIKKLSAVETLGATHLICTDKTGTLTKNEMTVQNFWCGMKEYEVEGLGYEPKGKIILNGKKLSETEQKKLENLLSIGVLSSNATINPPDSEHRVWYAIGDPTEAALITLAEKGGYQAKKLEEQFKEIKQFPFDAVRKMMSSVRQNGKELTLFVKGSTGSILNNCNRIWDGKKVRPITKADIKMILEKDDDYASDALRVLSYAYRALNEKSAKDPMEKVETKLIYAGLIAMIDPPRKEVKEAILAAKKAFIRVIIITGDYALTAQAIAKRIGLTGDNKKAEVKVVTGDELAKLTDIDLLTRLIDTNLIFSRTSPEDKLRIVNLLRNASEIVAVTGDGVNDAPALKRADIGVAMGQTGTEVAKDSSSIILLNDSFATLVEAIKEGRVIFYNLKKTIISSMTSNGGELVAVILSLFGTYFFGYPLAILAVQILAIDLVGEMLPLTFLTWDPPQSKIMQEPPRNPNQHILNKSILVDLAWSGFLMGAIGYANFLMVFARANVSAVNFDMQNELYFRATTLTYVSIVFVQWMNIISRRAGATDSALTKYLWSNQRLIFGFAISLFFILNIVYNPLISMYLKTAPLNIIDWISAITGALIYLSIRELTKTIRRRKKLALQTA